MRINLFTRVENILKGEWIVLMVMISIFLISGMALAETDPKDLVPIPAGTDVFLVYHRSISGTDMYQDGDKVSNNADFSCQLTMARYVHAFGVWGGTLQLNIIQPFGSIDLELGELDDSNNDLGDTVLNASYYYPFVNEDKNKLFLGAAIYVIPPTGGYDSEKSVNLGSNRWAYRPGIFFAWEIDRLLIEGTGTIDFYSDNTDYSVDSLTEEKDPLYVAECHFSYNFTQSFYTSLSYRWSKGGETELEGIGSMNDETDTKEMMFTAAVTITPQTQLMLQYSTDLDVENGIKQDYVGVRWAYFW